MSSELLNSYISNKPMSQSAAVPVVQPVQKAQSAAVDTTVKPDTFEKKTDKKKIAAIAAGALILGGGFIILGKKGKLGEGIQGFINKLFGSKTAETAVNNKGAARSYDDIIEGVSKKAAANNNGSNIPAKKNLPPEIFPVKIDKNGVKLFEPFEVQHNPKSIADDVSDWAQMHKNMPKSASPGSSLTINQEFTEFEIKPHKYVDDTDILMTARDYTCDFQTYKIEDGKMSRINGHARDGIAHGDREELAFFRNGYTGQVGHYDDGRKFVSLRFQNGEKVDSRPGYETITLISRGSEFTQAQKDAIRIFKTVGDRKFEAGIPTPFTFATVTPAGIPGWRSNIARRTNRNALLSAISSWAENSPKFNVDEYIQKTGGTFNIGF